MKKFYLFLYLLISYQYANAQAGSLDPSFGVNGVEKIKYIPKGTLISEKGESYQIEVKNAYYTTTVKVYKYLSNGLPDNNFSTTGGTFPINLIYFGAIIENDGRIIVIGQAQYSSKKDDIGLVTFNTDGSLAGYSTINHAPPNKFLLHVSSKVS